MTKSITTFDVVLVPFPFADLSATKRRPCLVLATTKPRSLPQHLVVCMMTSQIGGMHFPADHLLLSGKAAGLPKPTLVRLAKIVTIEESLVRKKLGSLAEVDRKALRAAFRELFAKLTT
jgi:mRNA interferase MazF